MFVRNTKAAGTEEIISENPASTDARNGIGLCDQVYESRLEDATAYRNYTCPGVVLFIYYYFPVRGETGLGHWPSEHR